MPLVVAMLLLLLLLLSLGKPSGNPWFRLGGTGTAPSLTSHGKEKPRPLAVSERVSSAREVVLWPRRSASQLRALEAARRTWRIRRRWMSAREVVEGRDWRIWERRWEGEGVVVVVVVVGFEEWEWEE